MSYSKHAQAIPGQRCLQGMTSIRNSEVIEHGKIGRRLLLGLQILRSWKGTSRNLGRNHDPETMLVVGVAFKKP